MSGFGMRISDWSSAVCPYDLVDDIVVAAAIGFRQSIVEQCERCIGATGFDQHQRQSVDREQRLVVRDGIGACAKRNDLTIRALGFGVTMQRSAERGVGHGWVRTCRSRWAP